MEFPDEEYRDICCIKTLYSTKEGFFNELVRIMFEKIESKWIKNEFRKQQTEEDKIRLCCNNSKVWNTLQDILQNICKVYRKKCNEAAKSSRLEGDLQCKIGDYNKAVMLYSQSVIRASQTQGDKSDDYGYSLALAYKGRANALFHLQHYQDCLTDLNMALKEGFPNALKYQIFRQMGECYKGLLEVNKAQISLQVALKLIDDQILKLETTVVKHGTKEDKAKDKALKNVLDTEREEIKQVMAQLPLIEGETKPENLEPIIQYIGGPLPNLTNAPNEKYPNASNLVTIKQSEGAGRFAVAADKIETGATLIVEEPHASLLIPKMLASHCLHCFTRLYTPVPCKVCSGVAFCSIKCRDEATSSYHKYECEFLGLFLGSGMSTLSLLALRMVTQERLAFFKQLKTKIDAMKSSKDPQSVSNFSERESQYMRVYNLTTHSYQRTSEDYFRRTLMAIFLVKCLKGSDFFEVNTKKNNSKTFSEDEILTASIILHHLELLQFNAHEIYETRVGSSKQASDSKTHFIAIGIYPTVALFNHECAPSVTRYFNGKNIVIKAVRPLEKHEILSENYGPHYAKKCLYERIRELSSRYWFKCECRACLEDWPLIDQLTPEDFKIKCKTPSCKGYFCQPKSKKNSETHPICQYCLRKTDVLSVMKRKSQIEIFFEKALDYMDSGNCGKAIPLLISYLDDIYQLGSPPCREMFLCQEALRTCFAQTGNIWIMD